MKAKVLFPLDNQGARTQNEAENQIANVLEKGECVPRIFPCLSFLIERRYKYVGRKKDDLHRSASSLCLL